MVGWVAVVFTRFSCLLTCHLDRPARFLAAFQAGRAYRDGNG